MCRQLISLLKYDLREDSNNKLYIYTIYVISCLLCFEDQINPFNEENLMSLSNIDTIDYFVNERI